MANINKVALLNNGKVVGAGRNKDNSNLAPIEATTTASRSYQVGDYLMLQGEFYKVISAIAIGDTLAVGTNIQAMSVGNVLTQLNNSIPSITIKTDSQMVSFDSNGKGSITDSDITTNSIVVMKTNSGGTVMTQEYSRENGKVYIVARTTSGAYTSQATIHYTILNIS